MDFTVTTDVVVIGGGIAGAAAAIQSARSGKKTILIEKNILLGGLATSGLVYIYLPLCDGNGHQVSFGITEELLRNSLELGPGEIPETWASAQNAEEDGRLLCKFSPAAYMLSLEQLLLKEGVELWLDTLLCDTVCQNGQILAAIVQNESGRGQIKAKCFVDASGSAIMARRAGLPCLQEDNYLTLWSINYSQGASTFFGDNLSVMTSTAVDLNPPHAIWMPPQLREKLYPGLTDEEFRQKVTYRGLTGKTVTDFVTESHRLARQYFAIQREKGKDRNQEYALKLPLMPQMRKTYCLDADYVLKDGENNTRFEDSVGLLADWRKAGPVWEVPYRSLYTQKMRNLLMAGRCTGAAGDAWEITRVIPSAGLTGQVAGLAASMAIDHDLAVSEVKVPELQAGLQDQGVKLHLPEVGLAYK